MLGTMGLHMTALSPRHREFPGLLLDKAFEMYFVYQFLCDEYFRRTLSWVHVSSISTNPVLQPAILSNSDSHTHKKNVDS